MQGDEHRADILPGGDAFEEARGLVEQKPGREKVSVRALCLRASRETKRAFQITTRKQTCRFPTGPKATGKRENGPHSGPRPRRRRRTAR